MTPPAVRSGSSVAAICLLCVLVTSGCAVNPGMYECIQSPTPPPSDNTLTIDCGGGVEMVCVPVPAGSFLMGTDSRDWPMFIYCRPVHRVTISRAFYMGRYEVTQAQYRAVTGKNPSRFVGRPDLPVEQVSWDDAVAFCRALSMKTGRTVRLPSEAEWEYACKADHGNVDSKFFFGDDWKQLVNHAWDGDNSRGSTHPVGQKLPNSFWLYDMLGNVWEWCNEWYDPWYYGHSPPVDPPGPSSQVAVRVPVPGRPLLYFGRVLRGGSWSSHGYGDCRPVYRHDWSQPSPAGLTEQARVSEDHRLATSKDQATHRTLTASAYWRCRTSRFTPAPAGLNVGFRVVVERDTDSTPADGSALEE